MCNAREICDECGDFDCSHLNERNLKRRQEGGDFAKREENILKKLASERLTKGVMKTVVAPSGRTYSIFV